MADQYSSMQGLIPGKTTDAFTTPATFIAPSSTMKDGLAGAELRLLNTVIEVIY